MKSLLYGIAPAGAQYAGLFYSGREDENSPTRMQRSPGFCDQQVALRMPRALEPKSLPERAVHIFVLDQPAHGLRPLVDEYP